MLGQTNPLNKKELLRRNAQKGSLLLRKVRGVMCAIITDVVGLQPDPLNNM